MKKQITSIALLLLTGAVLFPPQALHAISIPTDYTQESKPATIKVLIAKAQSRTLIEAKGSHHLYNPLSNILISQSAGRKKGWVTPSAEGLVWGELIPSNFEVRLVPKDNQSSILINGIEYKGCVEIYDIKGQLYIVNEIDVERYLKSTLTAQFPQELDEEVMDAIAIVARTNAYYISARNPIDYWHVEAHDVGYQGYALTLQNLPIDRSINNTQQLIMSYHSVPFPATWTKDSAGKTADFSTIFRKQVTTPQGVEAPFAAYDRHKHAWKFSLSKQELAKALGAAGCTQLDLFKDSQSQKVYAAKLHDGAKSHQIDFTKLQASLSSSRLKSNDFDIQIQGNEVTFSGYGEGLGVGLCLFSASAMADKGHKAPKILETFFPGSRLEKKRCL